MPDRRPVWLTEEAWDRISDVLKGNGFGYGDHVVDEFWQDPVPWLTVNDNGQPVRMVLHHKLWSDGSSAPLDTPDEAATAMYRAVPVDQD